MEPTEERRIDDVQHAIDRLELEAVQLESSKSEHPGNQPLIDRNRAAVDTLRSILVTLIDEQ
jgi:hypothetical protein